MLIVLIMPMAKRLNLEEYLEAAKVLRCGVEQCISDKFLPLPNENLLGIVQYFFIDELLILDMGFSIADARYESVFNNPDFMLWRNDTTAFLKLAQKQKGLYDWEFLRNEFIDTLNYRLENRFIPLGDYSDKDLELPKGMMPIDELETPDIAYMESIGNGDKHIPVYGRDSEE